MRLPLHSRSSNNRHHVGIALDAVCLLSAGCAGVNAGGDVTHGVAPAGMDTVGTDVRATSISHDGESDREDADTVTYDGTSDSAGNDGTTKIDAVNGKSGDPGEYYPKDGDSVRIVVESDAIGHHVVRRW